MKVFKTINKLRIGSLAVLFVLYWLLNKLNKSRPNHTYIGLALSLPACSMHASVQRLPGYDML